MLGEQLIEECHQRRTLSRPRTREDAGVLAMIVSEYCGLFRCRLVGQLFESLSGYSFVLKPFALEA
jgi:hypothetical protein